MRRMHALTNGLALLILGLASSVQASRWQAVWPTINPNQDLTIEYPNEVNTRNQEPQQKQQPSPLNVRTNYELKDVTPDQEKYLHNKKRPQMFEKTKIIQRIRRLKDEGEEKTKIIYRTRIIGPNNFKSSDFNYYNNDKIYDWLEDSEDDFSTETQPDKSDKLKQYGQRLSNTFDTFGEEQTVNTVGAQKNTQHSSKKELRFNLPPITIKSAEVQNNGRTINEIQSPQTSSVLQSPVKQQMPISPSFQPQIRNNIGMETPANKFWNIRDSLELALEARAKARQEADTKPINNTPIRPTFQRQFSVINEDYKTNPIHDTNPFTFVKPLMNNFTLKSILKSSVTSPLSRIVEENRRNDIFEKPHLDAAPVKPEISRPVQSNVVSNTVRPDWIGDLLINKVNPAGQNNIR